MGGGREEDDEEDDEEEDGRDLHCADAILLSEKKLPSWQEQSRGRAILTQISAAFTRSHVHTYSLTRVSFSHKSAVVTKPGRAYIFQEQATQQL